MKKKVVFTLEEQSHFVELAKLFMRIERYVNNQKAQKKAIRNLTGSLKGTLLHNYGIRYRNNMTFGA